MKMLQEYFKLKDDKISEPVVYLGATLFKKLLELGKT